MRKKIRYPIVGQFYTERSPDWDIQSCVNFYKGIDPTGDPEEVLLSTPGTILAQTVEEGSAPIRVLHTDGSYLYTVADENVYRYDTAFNQLSLGTLPTSNGNVWIQNNNSQVVFVDGNSIKVYDTVAETFTTATGFPTGPTMIDYLGGYFFTIKADTNLFYASPLNNATNWPSNRFALAQAQPGKLVGLATLHGRLFLFGEIASEVWYIPEGGTADFPVRRDNNLLLEYGCAAVGSIAKGHERLFWLAKDKDGVGSIKMTDGTVPITVSTPAVDYAIQNYTTFSDALGFVYKNDGHLFYQLTFPTADKTWLYDVTTNQWSQLEAFDRSRHLANDHAFFNNKHYVGSYLAPEIYELSSNYATDNGTFIRRERTGPHFNEPTNKMLKVSEFEIRIETGNALVTGFGSDPEVLLSYSRDSGHTFGNKHSRSMGKIGEYDKRIIWRPLGMSRNYTFKLEFLYPLKVTLMDAFITYRIGRS